MDDTKSQERQILMSDHEGVSALDKALASMRAILSDRSLTPSDTLPSVYGSALLEAGNVVQSGLPDRVLPIVQQVDHGSEQVAHGIADIGQCFYPAPSVFGNIVPLVYSGGREESPDLASIIASSALFRRPVHDHRWHPDSVTMGTVTCDGRTFTKLEYEGRLSMVTDKTVRTNGVHRFVVYTEGTMSVADGFGFVLSGVLPCKKNIQRIDSIFINKRGQICCRVRNEVSNLHASVAPLNAGRVVEMLVDLNKKELTFSVHTLPAYLQHQMSMVISTNTSDATLLECSQYLANDMFLAGRAVVNFGSLADRCPLGATGHFCAVVKNVGVRLTFLPTLWQPNDSSSKFGDLVLPPQPSLTGPHSELQNAIHPESEGSVSAPTVHMPHF